MEHVVALSDAYRGTALLMGEMLESEDPYTGGEHTWGVVALVAARRATSSGSTRASGGTSSSPRCCTTSASCAPRPRSSTSRAR